jgi:tol-pal system protein YbgF
MKIKSLISVSCILASGACFAQAPVVDAQDTAITQIKPTTNAANTLGVSEGGITSFELEQRLATIERVVDSRSESQQLMQSAVNELQNDIDDIRGSIELHNHQLEKLLERQRELFLELDRRFSDMQQSNTNLSTDIATVNASEAQSRSTPVMPERASAGDEQTSYQNAVNLILKDKDYEKAVPAFKTFLSQYPNTGLAANAHYWLGQLLYNQQNFVEAKEQFTQVANKFADSPKRGDSLLKLGLIEKAAGNASAANRLFKQVADEYPNSTPARLALQQLGN